MKRLRLSSLRLSSLRSRYFPPESIWAVEGSAANSAEPEDLELLKSSHKEVKPPLLFPWRHGTELPARIEERTKVEAAWVVATATAGFYFHMPVFRLLGNQWRQDLADSCSWAFVTGVAEILSSTYDVPVDPSARYGRGDDDISIDFHYNHPKEVEETPRDGADKGEKATEESKSSAKETEDNQVGNPLLEGRLANLFRDAKKSGKDNLQICLDTTPVSAELISLHALPGMSRKMKETHPQLFEEISNFSSKDGNDDLLKHRTRLMKEAGQVETTVFADVTVHCEERFWVKDLELGQIIQGSASGPRKVLHTIRLERVMTLSEQRGRSLGEWMITDIDDLLEGNRWFTPKLGSDHWWRAG